MRRKKGCRSQTPRLSRGAAFGFYGIIPLMQKILSAEARIVDGKIILHIEMEVSPDVFEFAKVVESGIRFTRQEKSALEMVRKELSNKEIAGEMNVSLSAVKKLVSSVLAKTGSQSRAEL